MLLGTTPSGFATNSASNICDLNCSHTTENSYDPQGRIRRQTITDAKTQQTTETVWRYENNKLTAVIHRVNNGRSTNCNSRITANPGGLTATASQQFIVPLAQPFRDADGSSMITANVNMQEYAKWLKANYNFTIAVGQ